MPINPESEPIPAMMDICDKDGMIYFAVKTLNDHQHKS